MLIGLMAWSELPYLMVSESFVHCLVFLGPFIRMRDLGTLMELIAPLWRLERSSTVVLEVEVVCDLGYSRNL